MKRTSRPKPDGVNAKAKQGLAILFDVEKAKKTSEYPFNSEC